MKIPYLAFTALLFYTPNLVTAGSLAPVLDEHDLMNIKINQNRADIENLEEDMNQVSDAIIYNDNRISNLETQTNYQQSDIDELRNAFVSYPASAFSYVTYGDTSTHTHCGIDPSSYSTIIRPYVVNDRGEPYPSCKLVAPVNIPAKHYLRGIKCVAKDNEAISDIKFRLVRQNLVEAYNTGYFGTQTVYETHSTTDSGSLQLLADSTHADGMLHVDNNKYTYYLEAEFTGDLQMWNGDMNSPTHHDISLLGCNVRYSETPPEGESKFDPVGGLQNK